MRAPEPELPIDPDLELTEAAGPTSPRRRRRSGGTTRRTRPGVYLAIAAGCALGAPARYGVAQVVHVAKNGFPYATFWTNVSGSLALGFLLALMLERFPPSRYLRPFVAIGVLGAFTTYSTFAVETDLLIEAGHLTVAFTYAVASLATGFLAVWVGVWAARALRLPARGGR
jgi:CrcB protein